MCFSGGACSRGGGVHPGRLHPPRAVHQGAVPHRADSRLPHQPGRHQDANQSHRTHRQGFLTAAAARHHPRTPAGLRRQRQKLFFKIQIYTFSG